MAVTETHNEIMLRCAPGARFTIWGSDVVLQFQRGKAKENYEFLKSWLEQYVKPEVEKEILAEQAKIAARYSNRRREGISHMTNPNPPNAVTAQAMQLGAIKQSAAVTPTNQQDEIRRNTFGIPNQLPAQPTTNCQACLIEAQRPGSETIAAHFHSCSRAQEEEAELMNGNAHAEDIPPSGMGNHDEGKPVQ